MLSIEAPVLRVDANAVFVLTGCAFAVIHLVTLARVGICFIGKLTVSGNCQYHRSHENHVDYRHADIAYAAFPSPPSCDLGPHSCQLISK